MIHSLKSGQQQHGKFGKCNRTTCSMLSSVSQTLPLSQHSPPQLLLPPQPPALPLGRGLAPSPPPPSPSLPSLRAIKKRPVQSKLHHKATYPKSPSEYVGHVKYGNSNLNVSFSHVCLMCPPPPSTPSVLQTIFKFIHPVCPKLPFRQSNFSLTPFFLEVSHTCSMEPKSKG